MVGHQGGGKRKKRKQLHNSILEKSANETARNKGAFQAEWQTLVSVMSKRLLEVKLETYTWQQK